jgi:hypothetical protein
LSAGQYIPIVINPGYLGVTPNSEIAYVTSVAGNVATLSRGQESSAISGPSGTVWMAGPLVSDFGMANMLSNGDVPGGSIPAGAVGYSGTNTQTGSYGVASGDVNYLIQMNNTASGVVTLSGAFANGQQITVYRANTGAVAISGAAGVTVVSTAATSAVPKLRVQYSVATAIYLGSNNWLVTGDIS